MTCRREFLAGSATALLSLGLPNKSWALGGTAALSAPITGPARLRMRATSLTKNSHWGIYVQEVAIRENRITPLSLIACFEFGRSQDPSVYGEIVSAPLPVIAEPAEPYRVAVYFFQNRDVVLQPHDDAALMANRLQSALDDKGRTLSLSAAYWDDANVPNANIHEISIGIEYLS